MDWPSKTSSQSVGLSGVTTSFPHPQQHLCAAGGEDHRNIKRAILEIVGNIFDKFMPQGGS